MSQTKQRRWTNKVFDMLQKEGFHPVDVEFGNGYFIFEHGKDMVVHFHVKELKGWKFGIWWNLDGEKKFDFFTQYERDIDKFKPSASTFVKEGVALDEVDVRYYVARMCRFIKKHPYRAWSIDQTFTRKIWDWDIHRGCFVEYWSEWWFRSVRAPRVHEKMRKMYLKTIEPITTSCLINPEIIDHNKADDGAICYPRYSVVCDGFIGEKLDPGHYGIDFREDLDGSLFRKVEKYNKKFARYEKHYGIVLSDIELGDDLGFIIRKKGKRKKEGKK